MKQRPSSKKCLHRVIFGVIITLLVVTANVVEAQCVTRFTATEAMQTSVLVFSGVVTEATRMPVGERLAFMVDGVWKGRLQKQSVLYRIPGSESLRISVGTRYLIFARPVSESLQNRFRQIGIDPSVVVSIGGCDSTTFENAERRDYLRELGQSREPD